MTSHVWYFRTSPLFSVLIGDQEEREGGYRGKGGKKGLNTVKVADGREGKRKRRVERGLFRGSKSLSGNNLNGRDRMDGGEGGFIKLL